MGKLHIIRLSFRTWPHTPSSHSYFLTECCLLMCLYIQAEKQQQKSKVETEPILTVVMWPNMRFLKAFDCVFFQFLFDSLQKNYIYILVFPSIFSSVVLLSDCTQDRQLERYDCVPTLLQFTHHVRESWHMFLILFNGNSCPVSCSNYCYTSYIEIISHFPEFKVVHLISYTQLQKCNTVPLI